MDLKLDICLVIFYGVDLKVMYGFDFFIYLFIKLSISCEFMVVNGKFVDIFEWDKLY